MRKFLSASLTQGDSMFVALSKFEIANGMTQEVRFAFRNRPHLVDHVQGFLKMEVISPFDNAAEFWLLTFWEDEASYHTWHKSEAHHQSHSGIPKGLKLCPQATEIRFFHHIAD